MAKSVLTFLIVAIATLQVALAIPFCKPPKRISYGGFKPYNNKFHVGARVYFFCDDYYEIAGSSSAKCLYSKYYGLAYWSHKPPVCRPKVKCLKLDNPKFGKVKFTGFKPGDKAIHFCKRGFVLKGDKIRTCLKGYWSGAPPKCKKIIRCPKLRLDYGFVKHTGFKPGATATHICDRCFKLKGKKVRTCQKKGVWSGGPPVCKRLKIDCGKPPTPKNGKVFLFKSTTCGSKAFHFCNRKHILIGNKVRVCQPNGFWSGNTPKCKPRKH